MEGIVFDIQRAALHDGPGLRTTVFLKGCPLRCAWSHNPESQELTPQTGKCGKVYGCKMSVQEVMTTVTADRAYYAVSGGGITLSGGEPTVQFDFCKALLSAAKAAGIHTCLDTSGHVSRARIETLLPLVDLWHFDYKATGALEHKKWTGVDGLLIQSNLKLLQERDARICLRCPLVPGANETTEHLARIQELETMEAFEAIERLPYHTIGNAKYADLSMNVPEFTGRTGPMLQCLPPDATTAREDPLHLQPY